MNTNNNACTDFSNRKSNGSKTSKNRPKSRKGNRRPKEVEVNMDRGRLNRADLIIGESSNDPAWYSNIKPLLDDMATYPFNNPIGLTVDMKDSKNQTSTVEARYTVPGVMQLAFSPTIGQCNDPNHAVNVAAQQLFTLTRQANSGAANYDRTEMLMLIIAMANAYMLYEELCRGYKAMQTYNYMNRYMPVTLCFALGFSTDIQKNLKDFKGMLDVFAYKLSSICIPDQFDIIKRWQYLCQNIFKDSENDRAQLYVTRPDGYYIWTEGVSARPTYLKYVSIGDLTGHTQPVYQTVDDMYTAMNKLLDPILGSEDVGLISGDMVKAFGESGMVKIALVDENSMIEPVYNIEALNQIMNTTTVNPVDASLDITQALDNTVTGPYLISNPYVIASLAVESPNYNNNLMNTVKRFLNLHDIEPSPDMVMTSSRFLSTTVNKHPVDGQTNPVFDIVCGTEVVNQVRYFINTASGINTIGLETVIDMIPNSGTTNAERILGWSGNNITLDNMVLLRHLALAEPFDFRPPYYVFEGTALTDAESVNFVCPMTDVDNYTTLDSTDLQNLHDVV